MLPYDASSSGSEGVTVVDSQDDLLQARHALLVATDEIAGLQARVARLEARLARSRARNRRLTERAEAPAAPADPGPESPSARLVSAVTAPFRSKR